MDKIMDGIAGMLTGFPAAAAKYNRRALEAPTLLSPVIRNSRTSFALNVRKYSTVKQLSIPALRFILVLLSGTDEPFTTGNISIGCVPPVQSHCAEKQTL
jgi:hypothetical protein